MPQLRREDGDDLGASDELIAFQDEGEQEEKRNVSAERDLDDVKSSLVNESETNSSSDSEVSQNGASVGLRGLQRCSALCLPALCAPLCRQTGAPSPVQMWRAGPDGASCARKVRRAGVAAAGRDYFQGWEGEGYAASYGEQQQENLKLISETLKISGNVQQRLTCSTVCPCVFAGTFYYLRYFTHICLVY